MAFSFLFPSLKLKLQLHHGQSEGQENTNILRQDLPPRVGSPGEHQGGCIVVDFRVILSGLKGRVQNNVLGRTNTAIYSNIVFMLLGTTRCMSPQLHMEDHQ